MGTNHVHCDKTRRIISEYNYIDKFSLEMCNPPIKEILDSSIRLVNVKKELICTCTGFKLCVKGLKMIKISYEACGCSGRIVCYKCSCPFFEVIPLDACTDVLNVCSKVCYCNVDAIGERCICVYNIIAINLLVAVKNNAVPHICEEMSHINCDNESKECEYNFTPICKANGIDVISECNEEKWKIKNDCL